jgi:hypothetical protein
LIKDKETGIIVRVGVVNGYPEAGKWDWEKLNGENVKAYSLAPSGYTFYGSVKQAQDAYEKWFGTVVAFGGVAFGAAAGANGAALNAGRMTKDLTQPLPRAKPVRPAGEPAAPKPAAAEKGSNAATDAQAALAQQREANAQKLLEEIKNTPLEKPSATNGSVPPPSQRRLPPPARSRQTQLAPPGTEPLPLSQKLANPGQHLKSLGKDALGRSYPGATIGGGPTHAHHIVMQEGLGAAGKKAVEESQAILMKHGIDPYRGVENLVWAPNNGYLKTDKYAQQVLERLNKADQTKEGITKALKDIAEIVSNGGKL